MMKAHPQNTLPILLTAAGLALQINTADAQFYGANNSNWNNPMSASADTIIQQNMERQRLKDSFRKKQVVKKKARRSRSAKKNSRIARSSRRTIRH